MEGDFIRVTPEMAEKWLEKNERNRRLNPKAVDDFVRYLKNGQMIEHGQTISFYKDGNIADGQTRLAAVAKSGISFNFWIITGVDPQASMAIDNHRARTTPDLLRIYTGDTWWNNNRVAMFRILWLFSKHKGKFDPNYILNLIEERPGIKQKIDFAYSKVKRAKNFGSAPFLAAVSTAYDYVHLERLKRFCQVVNTGLDATDNESAAIRIREYSLENKIHASIKTRKDFFLRTQNAISAFAQYRELKILKSPSKLIYPIFF